MAVVGKPKLMRMINRELLISVFRDKQELTNTELKNITGLSRRTINLIIESLKDIGVVKKDGYGTSTNEGGKRPVIYKFIPNSFYAVAVMVRDIKAHIGICNLNGEILFDDSVLIKWGMGRENVTKQLIKLINNIIARSKINQSRFLGIGIGVEGIIDSKSGTIKTLTRHKDWENYELAKILEKELKLPVVIKNPNHIRVLGEKWFGLANNYNNFVTVITTNDGIGAGVVLGNQLMNSNNCLLGEVGHIKIINNGMSFSQLRDFEYYLGLKHVNEIIKNNEKRKSYSDSPICKLVSSKVEVTFDDLFNCYNSGDEFSKVIIEEISKYFILLMEIIVCAYDPELILIHGKYSLLKDDYFEKISKIITKSLYPKVEKKIIIKRTTRTREMSILGAAGIIFEKIPI